MITEEEKVMLERWDNHSDREYEDEELKIFSRRLTEEVKIDLDYEKFRKALTLICEASKILSENSIPVKVKIEYYENRWDSLTPFKKEDRQQIADDIFHLNNAWLSKYFHRW